MFQFKQFAICQDRTAMKVGTDGVLLGAWAPIQDIPGSHFLDVGTGTGLIALMLAQRFPSALIDAIDIDLSSIEQSKENVEKSPFAGRIEIYHNSFQNFTPNVRYDSIVCNPPFFINSLHSPNQQRNLARHNDSLSFNDLLINSVRLLKDNGSICLILPVEEGEILINMAPQYGLNLKTLVCVHPTPDLPPKRILIHLVKSTSKDNIITQPDVSDITIELSRHHYTPEYISLTHNFYLKM